jgi:hypothetical protein
MNSQARYTESVETCMMRDIQAIGRIMVELIKGGTEFTNELREFYELTHDTPVEKICATAGVNGLGGHPWFQRWFPPGKEVTGRQGC